MPVHLTASNPDAIKGGWLESVDRVYLTLSAEDAVRLCLVLDLFVWCDIEKTAPNFGAMMERIHSELRQLDVVAEYCSKIPGVSYDAMTSHEALSVGTSEALQWGEGKITQITGSLAGF